MIVNRITSCPHEPWLPLMISNGYENIQEGWELEMR